MTSADLGEGRALLWLFGYVVVWMALGFAIAAVSAWAVLGPMYRLRALANGGPFVSGDRVRVLAGPHRGHAGRVYAAWQGERVRVDLGPAAQAAFTDIFAQTQLCRDPDRG